ncbi:hypothetical protein J2Z66_007123 [Paenibacillus eucommiae]|uniref:Uncharacterized protein n=1 Tax=Paenibacillus eucommiae TaxID=1355755 RepID=A0ABS4J6J5_9BACL|nr:hypothetical protein [Paenibacillus eucommiae]
MAYAKKETLRNLLELYMYELSSYPINIHLNGGFFNLPEHILVISPCQDYRPIADKRTTVFKRCIVIKKIIIN